MLREEGWNVACGGVLSNSLDRFAYVAARHTVAWRRPGTYIGDSAIAIIIVANPAFGGKEGTREFIRHRTAPGWFTA